MRNGLLVETVIFFSLSCDSSVRGFITERLEIVCFSSVPRYVRCHSFCRCLYNGIFVKEQSSMTRNYMYVLELICKVKKLASMDSSELYAGFQAISLGNPRVWYQSTCSSIEYAAKYQSVRVDVDEYTSCMLLLWVTQLHIWQYSIL